MAAPAAPTLFPKITQHVSEVVRALKELERDPEYAYNGSILVSVPLSGSVKLHGTHADILIYDDDRIVLQSKNVCNITVANDNLGFADSMADKTSTILELRDSCLARWKSLNPDTPLSLTQPILVAGEWIGTGIQKDVAIVQLSRRFVIISISINGSWVPNTAYADIESPSSCIYNISRGGTFTATLHPNDVAGTIAEVSPFAEAVALSCPFAASFGVLGEGEGIVWKPSHEALNANPALWFKTKGGRFKPSFTPAPKTVPKDTQRKRDAADHLAVLWCSEERMQQGWDWLNETGMMRDMKALGKFLKWVQGDVLAEERGYLQANGVDEGMLKVSIARVARMWYIQRIDLGGE
ncbi:hypothetical protein SVAN01_01181 [Stagonosporopsis vannaccii]|nr:hypothetical protein SVAN01_01181 [Stagonosporopsis vannaccii]